MGDPILNDFELVVQHALLGWGLIVIGVAAVVLLLKLVIALLTLASIAD